MSDIQNTRSETPPVEPRVGDANRPFHLVFLQWRPWELPLAIILWVYIALGVMLFVGIIVSIVAISDTSDTGTDFDFEPSSQTRLEQLHDDCAGGDDAACDDLFRESPSGSAEEVFGDTCGGRQPAGTSAWCD